MKILFLSDVYPPPAFGGYEMRCKEQVTELKKRGHKAFVLTSRLGIKKNNEESAVFRLLHFHKMGFGSLRANKKTNFFDLFKRYNQLKLAFVCRSNYLISKRIMAILKPDIVYAWQIEKITISPVLAAQNHGIPIVFNIGDYWLSRLKAELCLEPNAIKRKYRAIILGLSNFNRINLKYMLVNSRSLKQKYVEFGFSENNITVIPRGIPSHLVLDAQNLSDMSNMDKNRVNLVFVGRLVPEKGPDVAIKGLAHVIHDMNLDNVRLDIFGIGTKEYLNELQNTIFSLGLGERVHFMGQVEHHQLLSHYQNYDILLFTSSWDEPFSAIILEAMARGLPVIATNVGSVSEVITDGLNGLVVPKDEPMVLSRAIMRMIRENGLAHKIRFAALETVRKNFSFEHIVDEIEEYLKRVKREKTKYVTKYRENN